MQVAVAVVGKPRDRSMAAAIADYESRASRYWPLHVHEVREEGARAAGSVTGLRTKEGERLLARLPAGAHLVACDESGVHMTSEQFARWLAGWRDRATSVAFIVGGAYGLGAVVRERANTFLALAGWTLPHELARLVLAEQLYRAGTLVRGEPYHKR